MTPPRHPRNTMHPTPAFDAHGPAHAPPILRDYLLDRLEPCLPGIIAAMMGAPFGILFAYYF